MAFNQNSPEKRARVLEMFTRAAIAFRGNDPYNTADHWTRYWNAVGDTVGYDSAGNGTRFTF